MSVEIIIILVCILLIAGCFFMGWRLGGKSREEAIRRKGLEDVNSHYEKMSESFKAVDETIDRAQSLLKPGVHSNSDRSPKISAPVRASRRKRTQNFS